MPPGKGRKRNARALALIASCSAPIARYPRKNPCPEPLRKTPRGHQTRLAVHRGRVMPKKKPIAPAECQSSAPRFLGHPNAATGLQRFRALTDGPPQKRSVTCAPRTFRHRSFFSDVPPVVPSFWPSSESTFSPCLPCQNTHSKLTASPARWTWPPTPRYFGCCAIISNSSARNLVAASASAAPAPFTSTAFRPGPA